MAVGQVNAHDPRVKRTRQLLHQTMLDLMQEKSFASITVQDIAERSTLNRATFYAHFEDKYDLLDSIMREGVQQALAASVPDPAPLNRATLQAVCRTMFIYLAGIQNHCKSRDRQLDPMLEKAAQEVLEGFMMHWLQQAPPHSLPCGACVDTVAAVMSWAIFGAASQWSQDARTRSADEVATQVATILIDGVAGALPAA